MLNWKYTYLRIKWFFLLSVRNFEILIFCNREILFGVLLCMLLSLAISNFGNKLLHVLVQLLQRSWTVIHITRNSAIADKPCDTFVQMQWHGWPKTRPSQYLVPCRIWLFVLKGVCINVEPPKIGEPWSSALLQWGHGWPQDTHPSPHVLPCRSW